jgi:hypothetical protein
MPRKWHVRFLGGCGPATGRAYPTSKPAYRISTKRRQARPGEGSSIANHFE